MIYQNLNVIYNNGYYVIVTVGECSSAPSNTITVSNVGIESIENTNKISVYPNPVANELTIEAVGNTEAMTFDILNSVGQIVYQGTMTEKASVETSNFATGMYVLRLVNGKTIQYKKIIKE